MFNNFDFDFKLYNVFMNFYNIIWKNVKKHNFNYFILSNWLFRFWRRVDTFLFWRRIDCRLKEFTTILMLMMHMNLRMIKSIILKDVVNEWLVLATWEQTVVDNLLLYLLRFLRGGLDEVMKMINNKLILFGSLFLF